VVKNDPGSLATKTLIDPDESIYDHTAKHCDVLGGEVADYGLVKKYVGLGGEFIIPTPDYKSDRNMGQWL
jgi:hypothetical protein